MRVVLFWTRIECTRDIFYEPYGIPLRLCEPNCYVALVKLKGLESKGRIGNLKYMPVLLGGLFKSTQDGPLPKGSLEYNYMVRNLARLSERLGFKFSHDRFPVSSLKAMRGSYYARAKGMEGEYIERMFHACWAEDLDISDGAVLRNIVSDSLGFDYEDYMIFIEKGETKEKLRADTQAAFERGVFGAPTFFMDGDMYWGTPEILWYLESVSEKS